MFLNQIAGSRGFSVYDVSRFGRFQDTDEAARWEFVCKSAGAPIHYCAEQFANDNSLVRAMMKSLKRVMAGEYSRELSVKVYQGQKRLSMQGFTMGGNPGYGLVRVLVSETGESKQILKPGERKALQRDRVVLAPVLPNEIKCVQKIFRLFVEERIGALRIARYLNSQNIFINGRKWDKADVGKILRNAKYAGSAVFGKRTEQLRSKSRPVPEDKWTITPGVWEPIVDPATFEEAQSIRHNRTINRSNESIFAALKRYIEQNGKLALSGLSSNKLPSLRTYKGRFGGTRKLCELLGYTDEKMLRQGETYSRLQKIRKELMLKIVSSNPDKLRISRPQHGNGRLRKHIDVVEGETVGVYLCRWFKPEVGRAQWALTISPQDRCSHFLLALLNEDNTATRKLVVVKKFKPKYRTFHFGANARFIEEGVTVGEYEDLYSALR